MLALQLLTGIGAELAADHPADHEQESKQDIERLIQAPRRRTVTIAVTKMI